MFNPRLKHGDGFKPKLIALSVAACFGLSATQVSANPTGGTVSSCSASFSASGNTLTITNTAGGGEARAAGAHRDRKSTRLNSSHLGISYAGFCFKKKKTGSP